MVHISCSNWDGCGMFPQHKGPKSATIAAWNTRARLSSTVATGVRVKPLEWEHTPGQEGKRYEQWRSSPIIGDYFIHKIKKSVFKWFTRAGGDEHTCPTLEAAKAAAQSDFASRILSSIDTAGPAGVVDAGWLRDTAMNVMLATEVDEAVRILFSAIGGEAEPVADLSEELISALEELRSINGDDAIDSRLGRIFDLRSALRKRHAK